VGIPANETCPFPGEFLYGLAAVGHVPTGLVNGGRGDDEVVRQHNLNALFPNDPVHDASMVLSWSFLEGKDERLRACSRLTPLANK
jgi:hypothetical protein